MTKFFVKDIKWKLTDDDEARTRWWNVERCLISLPEELEIELDDEAADKDDDELSDILSEKMKDLTGFYQYAFRWQKAAC